MESRISKALQNHKSGLNCAQAVVCTYADIFGVDEKTAFMFAEAFGAGMGSMQNTCGAISGLLMLLGLQNSSGCVEKITKASTYKIAKELIEKFKLKNGSTICSELKGLGGKSMLRSCDGCIEDACKIFEEFIFAASDSKIEA